MSNTDSYAWANPYGGAWGSAANWTDTTVAGSGGITGASNAVSIAGSTAANIFLTLTGSGAAAQLSATGQVLLWGTVAVGGALTLAASAAGSITDFELDGAASLAAGSLSLGQSGTLAVGNASTLAVSGSATLAGGFLLASGGSAVRLGGLIANHSNIIAVDDSSALEVGTAGGAAAGSIVIDAGQSAAVSGSMFGNLVVNGTLGVQAGSALAIDQGSLLSASAKTIGGGGTLVLSENSALSLGVADSAAIRFGGPAGTLSLAVLPTGTISGFAAGDVITVTGLATGLSYTQTAANVATLTLTNNGRPAGKLTLAGNYAGSLFHLKIDAAGNETITVQTAGSAPAPPAVITGTAGADTLYATAAGQILTGLGGGDTLSANGFTGIVFKDSSANLNASTIAGFAVSDSIDLTDMKPGTVSLILTAAPPAAGAAGPVVPGTLRVTDGSHSAAIQFAATALPVGSFVAAADGALGTSLKYVAVNADAYGFGAASGGTWSLAANWQNITTGGTATAAPGYGNAVTIAGAAGAGAAAYTNIKGSGVAASLTASGAVLLWGSLTVGSKLNGVSGALVQSGSLVLDGGAALLLAGGAQIGGLVALGGGSRLVAGGSLGFAGTGAGLLATGGSAAQFAAIAAGAATIGVDAASSVEFGTAGGAATGALTIDSGITAALAGSIAGNVVVNGTLAVAGSLAIVPFGGTAPQIGGSGTIAILPGGQLTLAGADSAAILFSPATGGTAAETLVLAGGLPTGSISGFGPGDTILVSSAVTTLSYRPTGGAAGTLTLLNGRVTVGVLSLAGSYTAGQFQLRAAASGQPAGITCAPVAGTAAGTLVGGNNDSYAWTNPAGGLWSNAGNWTDTTSGTAAAAAPGAANAVTISAYVAGPGAPVIAGPGAAASLYVGSSTEFTGNLAVGGTFTVVAGVALDGGAAVTAGNLLDYASLQVGGGSSLTVGGGAAINGSLGVVGGSSVQVTGQSQPGTITGTIAVDAGSVVEIGTAGTAAAGTLTIDSSQQEFLLGTIAANLVLNGVLAVTAGGAQHGTITGFGGATGSVSGSGTILISGALVLNASDSAALAFQGNASSSPCSLELQGPLPAAPISGFAGGDLIRLDQTVTGVSFNRVTGTLTLTNGGARIGALTLAGSFSASLFHVDVTAATGVASISVQAAAVAGVTATVSTASDAYRWTGAPGGNWSNAANWADTTTPATTTRVPGSRNAVTIAGLTTAGQYTTLGGSGAAASLTTSGNVLLTGTLAVGQKLTLAAGALALDAGAKLTAGPAAIAGTLTVGGGSSAAVSGTAVLNNGTVLALAGSTVQFGSVVGNNSTNVIAADGNSVVALGSAAGAVAGAVTEAGGVYAVFTGAIYGSAVINGTLAITGGGSLFIDLTGTAANDPYGNAPTISGTGVLALAEGSTLGLGAVDSAAISFTGPNATLQLAVLPTATITGFAVGDLIQLGQAVTGLAYRQVTATAATLTLSNGGTTVGILKLAGNFSAGTLAFHLDTAANGATATISLQSVGVAASQPALIKGTAGADLLTATASNQTLTGQGGGDTLNGGGFTGVTFKDTTANLNGTTIQNFLASDLLDFTDLTPGLAKVVSYAGGGLSVSDGTHTARLGLTFAGPPPATGGFAVAADSAGTGTKLAWVT